MQTRAFLDDEGDRWYARNRHLIGQWETPTALPFHDAPLRIIARNKLAPKRILEAGCSNGWRLWHLAQLHDADCWGIDPSSKAINEGREHFAPVSLFHGVATDLLRWRHRFDLVLAGFFLYVTGRSALLQSLAGLDHVTEDGGHLLLYDFAPDAPTKTPYRDVPGLYSYKLPDAYAQCFLATGMYREVDRIAYNHETHEIGDASPEHRAAAILLRKEETYRAD